MIGFLGFVGGPRRAAIAASVLIALAGAGEARAQAPLGNPNPINNTTSNTVTCTTAGKLPLQALRRGGGKSAGQQPNLVISKACTASTAGTYYYANVNIVAGGSLTFLEPQGNGTQINFWASNIIVENGGSLIAGSATVPYGARGGVLNIYLYGKNQSGTSDPYTVPGQGALCNGQLVANQSGPCGIPWSVWSNNGTSLLPMPGAGQSQDYFYDYGPNYGDGLCSDGHTQWSPTAGCGTGSLQVGYFGYKVLAVSYGGTLQLFGYKGTPLPKPPTKRPLVNVLPGLGQGGGQNPLAALLHPSAPSQSDDTAATEAAGATSTPQPNPALIDADPKNTGYSWMRLAANLSTEGAGTKSAPNTLTLSKSPGDRWWSAKDAIADQVVVTTTDYLPGHSEKLTISGLSGATLSFLNAVNYPHNGTKYPVASRLGSNAQRFINAGMDPDIINAAETRAAVALLTRSIRILSAGDLPAQTFEQASKIAANCQNGAVVPYCYYFGAHANFRQGLKQVQIQGVEFVNMGQGGKLGHYPIHFHMARKVPTDTFVKDSSINESQTRWIVLHDTQGVLLQRNVGWKSIGHGFFLESGTEADNKFYSNLGIFARAAVANPQNPRMVPGIFSAGPGFAGGGQFAPQTPDPFPFSTDIQHPTVFWISNGWNDFIGNMAAGAGACGAAYWLVSAQNNDMPDVMTTSNTWFNGEMKWTGYASLQNSTTTAGSTPLKVFYGNYATSTMTSFQTVASTAQCTGADYPGQSPPSLTSGTFPGIAGFAPAPTTPTSGMLSNQPANGTSYYPYVGGGGRVATLCPTTGGVPDCTTLTGTPPNGGAGVPPCSNGAGEANCAVTVLDHFTSSFHWAQTNFSAIWLRPQWFLVADSVLTDVQSGGLSFITSGDYSRASAIEGVWSVMRTSLLVGNTQTGNGYSANGGPFLNGTVQSLPCDDSSSPSVPPVLACTNIAEGVSFPLVNFGTGQRAFSIYDGPAYQESNIYLDITPTPCSNCVYASIPGVRKAGDGSCYLPNAAIAWKQPNGFFYPPSFHSSNLFFGNVEIRHYVIDALFQPNTYLQDTTQVMADYCPQLGNTYSSAMFTGFTDIDRQTELSDDDGTLTGLTNNATPAPTGTVSVNPADFFNAPVQTAECATDIGITPSLACPVNNAPQPTPTPVTATTSPYEYVTTAVFPQCGSTNTCTNWAIDCTNPSCYGVPLYRQYLTGTITPTKTREAAEWVADGCDINQTTPACRWPFVRMGGQATYQRSSLTANHGTYFIDTNVSLNTQNTENFTPTPPAAVNVFASGQTYYVYFVYALPTTQQTYQIYVGPGFNLTTDLQGMRSKLSVLPMVNSDVTLSSTLPAGWTAHYNDTTACGSTPNCYILQVTTDFSQLTDIQPVPANGMCLPSSFCTASGTSCGCALTASSPLAKANPAILAQCQQACSVWSVKQLDFPPAGVYGFAFTLPAGFTPDDQGQAHRPVPTLFPTTPSTSQPDWLAQFINTSIAPDNASPGQCYYPQLPGTNCPVLP